MEKKLDTTTENKIKEAARIVFYKKGFAATRTRDIAEEAGLNLALLNYYFRSKSKLFEIIMMETLSGFIQRIAIILNNEKTTLDEKVAAIAEHYIDTIIKDPEIPTFIVSEIRSNPGLLVKKLSFNEVVKNSAFFKQHNQAVQDGLITEPNPLHFLMNLMGLVVFPFIAKPILMGGNDITESDFNKIMQQRKKMIPIWVKAMMSA
ncbi:TetR/AcrR family transcriptional regulator [Flavobacterium sp. Fl-318]|uniref:TetR/AcrR family transcriptional regulator n=1 Tax=Flavobacterium cupriresistens TaxID=2893885 RepID=A0ABU4RBS5_9FLAO|nr:MULTISPECIES: TetR/AcrR family transcriptional regulator [unclassified Flavobacterium]MDX6189298.1 TetR/AcrR family transcriptional regulator [Flavobacterium sp. Fl-318]UFH41394.1 TetR/AcrR family transcriptional regulator [Flavobacterium sp. F-323]